MESRSQSHRSLANFSAAEVVQVAAFLHELVQATDLRHQAINDEGMWFRVITCDAATLLQKAEGKLSPVEILSGLTLAQIICPHDLLEGGEFGLISADIKLCEWLIALAEQFDLGARRPRISPSELRIYLKAIDEQYMALLTDRTQPFH